jgi:hypothetical protein
MRVFLIALVACSAAPRAPATAPAPVTTIVQEPRAGEPATLDMRAPVDVIAVLSQPALEASWISLGPAQLVLGGTSLQPLDPGRVLEIDLLEERGSDVRVGVRLEGIRFAIWTSRARLLSVIAHDQHVHAAAGRDITVGDDPTEVVLHAGARVTRLARQGDWTRIRYQGALEVEGWVPTDVLITRGPAGRVARRYPTGRKPLLVVTGANIRSEPRTGSRSLALVTYSSVIDIVKLLEDSWYEVLYQDADLRAHGFTSRRDPPGVVHRRRDVEAVPKVSAPDTIPGGTCLFVNGEPIGVVVGQATGTLSPSQRPGWSTFTVDTPWDTIELEVRGTIASALDTCASSVP